MHLPLLLTPGKWVDKGCSRKINDIFPPYEKVNINLKQKRQAKKGKKKGEIIERRGKAQRKGKERKEKKRKVKGKKKRQEKITGKRKEKKRKERKEGEKGK